MDEAERLLAQLAPARLPPAPLDRGAIALTVLLLVVAVVMACFLVVAWRRHRRRLAAARAWSVEARRGLDRLRAASDADVGQHGPADGTSWLSEASTLARRVALVGTERADIAPLSGDPWLRRLDALTGDDAFARGPARLLADGPYRRDVALDAVTRAAICDALERLIERQVERSDDAVGSLRHRRSRGSRAVPSETLA